MNYRIHVRQENKRSIKKTDSHRSLCSLIKCENQRQKDERRKEKENKY
jgi:hypothetical protein